LMLMRSECCSSSTPEAGSIDLLAVRVRLRRQRVSRHPSIRAGGPVLAFAGLRLVGLEPFDALAARRREPGRSAGDDGAGSCGCRKFFD
jgi:hypothetical protein